MTYVFTSYGEVYSGVLYNEFKFPGNQILIQKSKIAAYEAFNKQNQQLDRVNEFGYAIPDCTIRKIGSEQGYENNEISYYSPLWEDYDRKVMFIIGAGASANCVYGSLKKSFETDSYRPPLGNQLFDERFQSVYAKYPGVQESLYFLQGEDDVEGALETEWENVYKYGNGIVMSRHINIQYYLQEILRDVTVNTLQKYGAKNLYAKLADQLTKISVRDAFKRKKFAFVSFNQDTILESFLSKYSRQKITAMSEYTNINSLAFSIFKPHGSINWGWEFPDSEPRSISTAQWLYETEVNLYTLYYELLGNPANMVDWQSFGIAASYHDHQIGKHLVNRSNLSLVNGRENLYYPALLLPYKEKDEFTMPTSHYLDLSTYLGQVETLVIIGWKGNEKLFVNEIKKRAHRLNKIIIADPNLDIVLENLNSIINSGVSIVHYTGFEDFVENGVIAELS